MTVLVLLMLCAIFLCLLILACWRIETLECESKDIMEQDHAKCLAMVAAFVGDEFASRVLNAAAEDYDTAEGQANLIRVRNLMWVDGGPSIPSIWMRDRAHNILKEEW